MIVTWRHYVIASPQIQLRLTVVHAYKLCLLTYLIICITTAFHPQVSVDDITLGNDIINNNSDQRSESY